MAESTSIFEWDPNRIIETDDIPDETPADSPAPTPETPDVPEFTATPPEDLPPELADRWEEERRKHQRNYTKQLQRLQVHRKDIDQLRQKAAVVDRFYTDQQYAAQTIQQMAQQLGYSLVPARTSGTGSPPDVGPLPGPGTRQPGAPAIPAEILQAAEAAVADQPDLAFIAPIIAKAAYAITQAATKPLHEEAQARRDADAARYQSERAAEFDRMTAELEEEGVDWREHEDEMLERLTFLQNAIAGKGGWSHPKYGNFLRFLHSWTVGPRAAQAEAGKRLQRALQTRTTTGAPTRSPGVNVEQLIREAKTPTEQWQIAFKNAMAEVVPRR